MIYFGGAMASLTIAGIPAARAFPKTAAQTWAILFARGLAVIPPTAVGAALFYGYAAWDASSRPQSQWSYFATAAAFSAGVVPFTLIFMGATNDKLHAVANGVSVLSDASVLGLVDKWGWLNLVRSTLPLTATLVAGYGLFQELGLY
ncbi:hypothetical protein TWF694_005572 [Orbilia ellipsospora]|uniref:Uncharacterized protein n=1 Tax=Orbilia ellipsospora TaxID=2528407 RepID=A0AAV9WTI6_9PEZI